jgi:transcriptional regulator with XRE-family HTH domain
MRDAVTELPPTTLREAREAAGDSLESLALELGVDEGTVARWEASGSIPAGHLRALGERYGLGELYPIRRRSVRSRRRRALALVAAVVGVSALAGCTPALIAPGGKSLDSAYRSGADFIHLKPGNYSGQNLPQVNGHRFTLVNCAPGAKINGLTVYGDKLGFRGCDFDGQVYLQGAQQVTFTNSDFGPANNTMPLMVNGSEKSSGLTFTGNRFHDATATGDAHTECAWIAWADGLTMTGNRFERCTYFNIFLTQYEGSPPRNVKITGNTLCKSVGGPVGPAYYTVMVAPHIDAAVNYRISGNQLGRPIVNQAQSSSNVVTGPNTTTGC